LRDEACEAVRHAALLHMPNPGVNACPIGVGRVLQGIITTIGFLGAAAIIQGPERVYGATTGAGVWVVAAIGIACGFGLFVQANRRRSWCSERRRTSAPDAYSDAVSLDESSREAHRLSMDGRRRYPYREVNYAIAWL
jgi:hypothetical protein